jgi:hypothetical protein
MGLNFATLSVWRPEVEAVDEPALIHREPATSLLLAGEPVGQPLLDEAVVRVQFGTQSELVAQDADQLGTPLRPPLPRAIPSLRYASHSRAGVHWCGGRSICRARSANWVYTALGRQLLQPRIDCHRSSSILGTSYDVNRARGGRTGPRPRSIMRQPCLERICRPNRGGCTRDA